MIYVMMALYQEAHGLIRELELKNTAYAPFEVFDNESAGIRLVVTGVGRLLRLLRPRQSVRGWSRCGRLSRQYRLLRGRWL